MRTFASFHPPLTLALIVVIASTLLFGCGDGAERALETDGYHVQDLIVGDGRMAAAGDFVTVSYDVWLYENGEQGIAMEHVGEEGRGFVLGAGEVMPGWDAGIVGMREGGTRRILVAPAMIGRLYRPRGVAADEDLWSEITLEGIARIETTDLVPGEGRPVIPGDYVEIRYTGWNFENGAKADEFATSGEDEAPVGVMVGAGMVNTGLDLGLEGMRVGGRRQVVVPPALAYGKQGRDPVKPDATLLYEVEIVARPEVVNETVQEGRGEPVSAGQRVSFHLAGWIRQPDGSKGDQFQDSLQMGQPITVVLGDFKIQPGLELGIRGMKPGEVRRLEVPSAMAFGPRGWHRGDRTLVPPDTDVIYEVTLLGVGVQVR